MKTDLVFDIPFPGHCEDAPPVADERMAIVCDGLGGAGGVEFTVDGEVHTCAYYASRAVMAIVKEFLEAKRDLVFSDGMRHLDQIVADMRVDIKKGLWEYSKKTGITFKGRKSGGSMVKLLPTTLASCVYRDAGDSVEVVCFWAGDSRCYALCQDGLHQLMDDDARGYIDAMECLIQDAVMNNVICLDHDFHISWKAYRIPKPCFVFAASDGCFAYLDSPMRFESVFLPRTDAEFDLEGSIKASLEAHENDDRTLAGHIFGVESEEEYRKAFCPRGDAVESEFISKMVLTDRIDELRMKRNEMGSRDLTDEEKVEYKEVKTELKELRKQNEDLMRTLWRTYSEGYLLEPLAPEQDAVVVPEEPVMEEEEPAVPAEAEEAPASKEPEAKEEPVKKDEKPAKTDEKPPKAEEKPVKHAVKIPVKGSDTPSIEDELSPSYTDKEDLPPSPSHEFMPGVVKGEDWTIPKRTINDSSVSLIMPYATSKSFMKATRMVGSVEGYQILNNWLLSGDALSAIGMRKGIRDYRRVFVKKRDSYDIIRDTDILSIVANLNRKGRFILPSERYMPTDRYVQMFICTQSGMDDIDDLRRFDRMDKLHLLLELSHSIKDLHEAGVVHGAVSPESMTVLQTRGGHLRPVLCNFCDSFRFKDRDRLDRMDPVEKGPWYDVYCLGLLFYRICVRNVSNEIIVTQANIYSKKKGGDWLMDLICCMLDRDPSRRPTISDVIDTLRRHMD